MLTSLLLIIEALVPTGAYSMPALCKTLSTITGVPHEVSAQLVDYPVFVSIKNGDPKRTEKLVAIALHGEWVSTGSNTITLRPRKREKDHSFEAFKAMYLEATKENTLRHSLPLLALYALAPGEILRFSTFPNQYSQAFPVAATTSESQQNLMVRRVAPGIFEFKVGTGDIGNGDTEVSLSGLPNEVKQLIGKDLRVNPFTGNEKSLLTTTINTIYKNKLKWDSTGLEDPIGEIHRILLGPTAAAMKADLVMALPDVSIFAIMNPKSRSNVEEVLSQYSMSLQWTTEDGAVIGKITQCEIDHPAQCKRDVLRTFLDRSAKEGAMNANSLSDYVSTQRPASSESWTDAMMLALSGAVIDQEYIGDYPFNIRLYTAFDQGDWAKLKSDKPFFANELSGPAKSQLLTLLLQSRARLEVRKSDPAYWQTLDFDKLTIEPKLEETPVLISFTTIGGEVYTVENAALNFDLRRKGMDHEPTYQMANRRRLVLTIHSQQPEESVETGFSEVSPVSAKAVTWHELPKDVMMQFKKVLDQVRKSRQGVVGTPPPR